MKKPDLTEFTKTPRGTTRYGPGMVQVWSVVDQKPHRNNNKSRGIGPQNQKTIKTFSFQKFKRLLQEFHGGKGFASPGNSHSLTLKIVLFLNGKSSFTARPWENSAMIWVGQHQKKITNREHNFVIIKLLLIHIWHQTMINLSRFF